MQELRGRNAVITGAGSGIGRGMAVAFAREGMNVMVSDLELDAAERVADEVRPLIEWHDARMMEDFDRLAEFERSRSA